MNTFENIEKITPQELEGARLPEDPSKFEEGLKGALLEKRKIREKVLSVPKDERLPEMKYPTECPVKNWKDLFEMDVSMDEYTKRLFFERIESEYRYLSNLQKDEELLPIFRESKKRVDYILEKQIRSGIKKHIKKVSDVNDGAAQGVNFSSSEYLKRLNEKTTFIVGLLAEAGIDTPSHFTHEANISEIQNIPLLIRIVNRLKGIYSNAFEILYCYKTARDYGESFLETIISGEENIRLLNKNLVVRSVIEEKYTGDPTLLMYISGDPYLAEVARDTREEDAVFAATVIQKIREAQQEKVSKPPLDSFLYFTRLVSKNRDIVEKMEWSSEFLQKNNMMYESPSTIILLCSGAPDLLPLPYKDENNWKTKKTLGWKYLEETNPCIVEMKEKFGIPDSSDRIYLDFNGDFCAHAQLDIAKLRFLSDRPEFQEFIAEKFFVRDINDLVKYTNFILEKRSRDPLLPERIDASYFLYQSLRGEDFHGIEDIAFLYETSGDPAFIRWLPTLYKETGLNSINVLKESSIGYIEAETNAWKNWYEHQDDFHTAVSLGLFADGDPNEYLYSYQEFAKIIHQPELRAFIENNADMDLFGICLNDREFLETVSEKWLNDKESFYKAKKLGLFAMENYERGRKHTVTEYESIIAMFTNDQFLGLIEENPDIPLMNMWVHHSCGSGKNQDQCDSLLGWAQNKESLRRARFLGTIGAGKTWWIEKYHSKNLSYLSHIPQKSLEELKTLCENDRNMENIVMNNLTLYEIILTIPKKAKILMSEDFKEIREFIFNHTETLLKNENDLQFLGSILGEFGKKADSLIRGYQECLEAGVLSPRERELVPEFARKFRVISPIIMDGYKKSKHGGYEKVYVAQLTQYAEKLTKSEPLSEEERQWPLRQDLLKHVYPNNSGQWTNFESNETCADRSTDVSGFIKKSRYEIDLFSQSEIRVRDGETLNVQTQEEVQVPILQVSRKMSESNFDYEKIRDDLNKELDQTIQKILENDGLQEISLEDISSTEDKLFLILSDFLYGTKTTQKEFVKNFLISYEFAYFEDISDYIAGTRERIGSANNHDYALLCEVGSFYSDRIKEVNRRLVSSALVNPKISKLMPRYFESLAKKTLDSKRQDIINQSQIDKLGISESFLEQIKKSLKKRRGKEYSTDKIRELIDRYERKTGGFSEKTSTSDKPLTRAIYGQLRSQKEKTISALERILGEETNPAEIFLGEVNLQQVLNTEIKIEKGVYDEDQFASYTAQRFIDIFEEEQSKIETELGKYESLSGKKQERLYAYITKTKESAHARMVGGVCVSGDNPGGHPDQNIWEMPNYFQLVFQDPESFQCQGLVLLHHFTQDGKKILSASLNPSSTYLYSVDEDALLKGIFGCLIQFASENSFDAVVIPQNKAIRTNRTGGQFEKSMDNALSAIDKKFHFENPQQFSYHPSYHIQDMDVVWERQ